MSTEELGEVFCYILGAPPFFLNSEFPKGGGDGTREGKIVVWPRDFKVV